MVGEVRALAQQRGRRQDIKFDRRLGRWRRKAAPGRGSRAHHGRHRAERAAVSDPGGRDHRRQPGAERGHRAGAPGHHADGTEVTQQNAQRWWKQASLRPQARSRRRAGQLAQAVSVFRIDGACHVRPPPRPRYAPAGTCRKGRKGRSGESPPRALWRRPPSESQFSAHWPWPPRTPRRRRLGKPSEHWRYGPASTARFCCVIDGARGLFSKRWLAPQCR